MVQFRRPNLMAGSSIRQVICCQAGLAQHPVYEKPGLRVRLQPGSLARGAGFLPELSQGRIEIIRSAELFDVCGSFASEVTVALVSRTERADVKGLICRLILICAVSPGARLGISMR